MGRKKLNALGLCMRDYELTFSGWDIPRSAWSDAWHHNLTYEQAKQRFVDRAMKEKIKPKRRRQLGLKTLRRMVQRDLKELGMKYAARRLKTDARAWLVKHFPMTRDVPRLEELASRGSIDLTCGNIEKGDLTTPTIERGDLNTPYVAPRIIDWERMK